MSQVFFCNLANLKKFAKVLSRRFGMPVTRAQEDLCRAGGYQDWHHLQKAIAICSTDGAEQVPLVAWRNSLRQALGADIDQLLSSEELVVWWRRLCVRKGVELDVLGELATVNDLDEVSVRLATLKLQTIEEKVPMAVRAMLGDLPIGSRLQFYTQPRGSLTGMTPLQALQAGKVAAVKRAAEGFRER